MKTFWTFLTGVAAGAVVALFYAPDRGTETRRKIAESARRMAGNAREQIEEGIDEFSEQGERLYKKAGNMAERTTGRSGSSRSNY
jgi:gas vesicle protein